MLRKPLHILLFLFLVVLGHKMAAQYPHYFSHDDENGLPSNEVFSIIQDSQGFIWLGLDAGLYRFDGVRYHQYKSIDQKSKSMTGLTMSSSGGIYCYNFRSQLFYLNNDSLIEIRHELKRIYGLATDKRGNLYASHSGGISQYSEVKKNGPIISTFLQNSLAYQAS